MLLVEKQWGTEFVSNVYFVIFRAENMKPSTAMEYVSEVNLWENSFSWHLEKLLEKFAQR